MVSDQSIPLDPISPGSRSSARVAPDLLEPSSPKEALLQSRGNKHSLLIRVVQWLMRLSPCTAHKSLSIKLLMSAWAALSTIGTCYAKRKTASLPRLLLEQQFSVMTPESDFRLVKLASQLLASHPLWDCWEEGLVYSATCWSHTAPTK
jgi:hypothetical protein